MSAALVTQYEEHLALVRNLSDNSIRGYVTDLESFLKHMEKLGIVEFNQLEIEHIRSWLANLQSTGVARATLTRRIVSIRAFTNWAAANGWLTSDLGANLSVPKPHKVLPEVLNVNEAATVIKSLEVKAAEEPSAENIRDLAMLEVLYGSGIRVSELCGLNLSDIDNSRNTLNVTSDKDNVYTQLSHLYIGAIIISILFYIFAGDGKFNSFTNPSMQFIFRKWFVNPKEAWPIIFFMGCCGALAFALVFNAYNKGSPSTVSLFEYSLILYSIIIGYLIFDESPTTRTLIGASIIVLSGIYIYFREKVKNNLIVTENPIR